MAANRRRKKVEQEIIFKEPVTEITGELVNPATHLSSPDLLKCETLSRDVHAAKLLMFVEEQALKNMLLEQSLLALKIEKQKSLVHNKAGEYEASKSLYAKFLDALRPRYGLTEKESFGYNDETGEIIKS